MRQSVLTFCVLCVAVVGVTLAQDEPAKTKPDAKKAKLATKAKTTEAPAKQDAAGKEAAQELKTALEKGSYALGLNFGRRLASQGIVELDTKLFARGLADALAKRKALLSDEEIREAFAALDQEIQKRAAERTKVLGEKNLKEGPAFLAENKKK